MNKKVKLLIVIFSICCCHHLSAQYKFYYPPNGNTFTIDSDNEKQKIPQSTFLYLTDTGNQLTFKDLVSSDYRDKFNKQFSWSFDKTVWVRFTIFNKTKNSNTRIINLGNIDYAKVFIHHEQGTMAESETGFKVKTYQDRIIYEPTLQITIPKDRAATVYLGIKQATLPYPSLDFEISTLANWHSKWAKLEAYKTKAFYILIALLVFVLILLIIKKEPASIPFIVISLALYLFLNRIIGEELIVTSSQISEGIFPQAILICYIFILHLLRFQHYTMPIKALEIYLFLRVLAYIFIVGYSSTSIFFNFPFHHIFFDTFMIGTVLLDMIVLGTIINKKIHDPKHLLTAFFVCIQLPWVWYFLRFPYAYYTLVGGTILGISFFSSYLFLAKKA